MPLGEDAPSGFRSEVEDMDGFNGWENFARGAPHGWDWSEEEPLAIVARNHSIYQEWEAELSRTVKPLPVEKVEDHGNEGDV